MKNYVESNKLIAEFMGFEHTNIGWYDNNEVLPEWLYDQLNGNTYDELQFNISWDWLMPVVGKCYEYAELGSYERTEIEESLVGIININITHKAVIEFIKWYNTNK